MPLQTTVVGAFPKPDYLDIPDWFRFRSGTDRKFADGMSWNIDTYSDFKQSEEQVKKTEEAMKEVISVQENVGIDVISDGEIKRENYIHYFCRHLEGMDFVNTEITVHREGATKMRVPKVCGPIKSAKPEPWCAEDWKSSQAMAKNPMKYTIPGPMTIADTTNNAFYKDHKQQLLDIALCVNKEVLALVAEGCKHIQIDEPILVRKPQVAIDYGIDILSSCFDGVGKDVEKIIHLCCGYPEYLDQEGYAKADRSCYAQIADKLDNAGFDALSIEDAHCHNDLSFLDLYKKSKIIFGSVAIAKSRVESPEEIEKRLRAALEHISPERLIVAPDCGLGYLPRDIIEQKLKNMVLAASHLP